MRGFFRSVVLYGLDIQSSGVRLIQLRKHEQLFVLECVMYRPAQLLLTDGRIKAWHALGVVLADMAGNLPAGKKRVAIAVPNHVTHAQTLSLAEHADAHFIAMEIENCIEQIFPIAVSKVAYDFCENREGDGMKNVFVTMMESDYLKDYAACLSQATLSPSIADIDIYALQRVFLSVLKQSAAEEDYLILYENDVTVMLFFLNGSDILFHRRFAGSGFFRKIPELKAAMTDLLKDFSYKKTEKLYVCVHYLDEARKIALADCFDVKAVVPLDILANIVFKDEKQEPLLKNQTSDFAIAMGLAMREVPAW
ncbi:MAG TPA: pilus assembly protein PilM [Gammaproteobacteria bacterium]|jgi:Tfp pilus assembly PilM family ATPase|nr:pilus assembly protein PilM [Gammaproteobacteria bacterium]